MKVWKRIKILKNTVHINKAANGSFQNLTKMWLETFETTELKIKLSFNWFTKIKT